MLSLIIIAGCQDQPVQPDPKPGLSIPAYGDTPLPATAPPPAASGGVAMKSGAAGNNKPNLSGYEFLKNYLDTHKKYTWLAIAGVWKPTPGKYGYRRIPLQFPDSIVAKADGETIYYTYTRTREEGRVDRKLGAIIPAGKTARAMMNDWLKIKTKKRATTPATPSEGPDPIRSTVDHCEETTGETTCWEFPELGVGWCEEVVVCGDAPDGGPPPADGDEDEGGGGNPCPTCSGGAGDDDPGSDDDGSDDSELCISITGKKVPCEELEDDFEDRIDYADLDECMEDEMLELMNNTNTGVGEIIQDFALDELNPGTLGNLNWTVKDGGLPDNVNGRTSLDYNQLTNTVTTIFDSGKFINATDLSVVRTMLHEAVHAWVVSITFTDALSTEEQNNLFGDNWIHAFENAGHNFIATDFVTDIANGLEAFGNSRGYNLSRQFYEDMAWGGLYSTPEFANLSAQEQQQIKDTVHAEQYGTDTDGNYQAQKGDDAGC